MDAVVGLLHQQDLRAASNSLLLTGTETSSVCHIQHWTAAPAHQRYSRSLQPLLFLLLHRCYRRTPSSQSQSWARSNRHIQTSRNVAWQLRREGGAPPTGLLVLSVGHVEEQPFPITTYRSFEKANFQLRPPPLFSIGTFNSFHLVAHQSFSSALASSYSSQS